MIRLLVLLLVVSCAHHELQLDGKVTDAKFISKKNYKEIHGAKNALRNVSGATLLITFRQTGKQDDPQDMLAFSIGDDKPTLASRASLRMDKDGYLTGIARSVDSEDSQTVRAKETVDTGDFHKAALVVDYAQDSMRLYLDGRPLETEGKVAFKSDKTSDTPSASATMGAEDDGSTFFFQGELKEPKIWSRALTAEEVLMNSQD